MNPTHFAPFARVCHLTNTAIEVNYLLLIFASSTFNKLSTGVVFRGSRFTNFFLDDSKKKRRSTTQFDLKYVFETNRILHDFKIPKLRLN